MMTSAKLSGMLCPNLLVKKWGCPKYVLNNLFIFCDSFYILGAFLESRGLLLIIGGPKRCVTCHDYNTTITGIAFYRYIHFKKNCSHHSASNEIQQPYVLTNMLGDSIPLWFDNVITTYMLNISWHSRILFLTMMDKYLSWEIWVMRDLKKCLSEPPMLTVLIKLLTFRHKKKWL